ncbi:hypothetical protein LOAG_03026 [Loa loa]|uniref:Uncharacterized protein n=1 Tax=Loa loa TaxID=7209 RepID=A0A1S0U5P4_LOALO|nr:hypothetical protein LOAG_03026 [Loa loa]EFO25456.1 hypothetical protein LOAG_03026 [Loa loa]
MGTKSVEKVREQGNSAEWGAEEKRIEKAIMQTYLTEMSRDALRSVIIPLSTTVVKVRPDDIASQITLVDIRSSQQLIRRQDKCFHCGLYLQMIRILLSPYFGPSEHGIFAKLRLLFESEHNWERLREHLNSAKFHPALVFTVAISMTTFGNSKRLSDDMS